MVTGRWKILIRPALATRRNGMVEGRRKMKQMRQTEGGNTGRWDNGIASVYLNLCVLMSRVNKSSWLSLASFEHLYADTEYAIFWQQIFFLLLLKTHFKMPLLPSKLPRLAHVYTKTSQTCEMNSIPNSFHPGVNSLFSSQRFILASSLYFSLNFMCHNVSSCFLGKEIKQSLHIYNPSHAHESINNPSCKCLPHENEMFSSIIVVFFFFLCKGTLAHESK